MSTTLRRTVGALLLIASIGTATCQALWHVSTDLQERGPAQVEAS